MNLRKHLKGSVVGYDPFEHIGMGRQLHRYSYGYTLGTLETPAAIALHIHFSVIYEQEGTGKLIDALLQFVERLAVNVVFYLRNQFFLGQVLDYIEHGSIFFHTTLALVGNTLRNSCSSRELGKIFE